VLAAAANDRLEQRGEQVPDLAPGAKFSFTRGQASADFSKDWRAPTDKKHGNELTPATETAGMTFRFCAGVPQIQIPGEGSTAEFVRKYC